MTTILNAHLTRLILGSTICLLLLGPLKSTAIAQELRLEEGRVYVMANSAMSNTIVVLKREEDGRLTFLQEVATGGVGSGPGTLPPPFPAGIPGPNGIDSQDALVVTDDGRFLIAVNAGSNDVSVLEITHEGLELVDRVSSGGIFPVSVAHHRDLIYVVNGGSPPHSSTGTPTVRGFRIDHEGKLRQIPYSTIVTGPDASQPSDAVFSPSGKALIIAEQSTQTIDVFRVTDDGLLEAGTRIPANNSAPLAVAFADHDIMAITEGVTSAPRVAVPKGSTMSSYKITTGDNLEPISKAVPTLQTAACWLRFTPDGRYAYTGNAGSGNLSSFLVSESGVLTLLDSVAADTGGFLSVPIDLYITPNGKYLYVLASFIGTVQGFRIESDGSLSQVASYAGLPISIQGIVAR
jgi:6-phosphogluconolactonase (cycloisomerase 2 family)